MDLRNDCAPIVEVALGCKEGSVAAQHHWGLLHRLNACAKLGASSPYKGSASLWHFAWLLRQECVLSLSICGKNTSFSFCVGLYRHKTFHSDHEFLSSSGIFMKYFQLSLLAFFLQGFCLGERYSILPEKLEIKMNIIFLGYLAMISYSLWYGKNWIWTEFT